MAIQYNQATLRMFVQSMVDRMNVTSQAQPNLRVYYDPGTITPVTSQVLIGGTGFFTMAGGGAASASNSSQVDLAVTANVANVNSAQDIRFWVSAEDSPPADPPDPDYWMFSGEVSGPGGGGDMELSSNSLSIGDIIRIPVGNWVITATNP